MKYLTQAGFEKLQKELEQRKNTMRQEIATAIKEAKEQGDLSENAEYTEARHQQRENEIRIMELESMLRTSKVIEQQKGKSGVITIGSKITAKIKGKNKEFEIVGASEFDPEKGKISNESPLGQAFLGRKKGDKVKLILPNKNEVEYVILKVY